MACKVPPEGHGLQGKVASSRLLVPTRITNLCSVLEKSHIGAKSDFEIWGFKGFFSLDPKKGPKEGS